tara:strand:+ start:4908 stop:5954 length:1047 start_codon:yes stop_codon:yes gene_type:complete
MIKHIVFSGGGSGGHVVPALTLIKELSQHGISVSYIGSQNGIERKLVGEYHLPYYPIATGKLRRYFSLQNFIDPLKIIWGFLQALCLLLPLKRKTTLVFSTGGFVSVPVVAAARLLGFKVFIHEQTSRVGLANRIAGKLAHKVFISFESSKQFFPRSKVVLSGYPVRSECFVPNLTHTFVSGIDLQKIDRPIMFITGGGNGSLLLNQAVKDELTELTTKYFVIHQVGSNFIQEYKKLESENYKPVAFIGEGMIDLFKKADLVLSRAGAGTVCELIALGKASVFIPLKIAQFNEQWHNAMEAKDKLGSLVISEDDFKSIKLNSLAVTQPNIASMKTNATKTIVEAIKNV